jgi:hypothetical protein
MIQRMPAMLRRNQLEFCERAYASGEVVPHQITRPHPSGFSRLAAPMLERAMRRATTKDLARLRAIIEAGELDA